MTTVRARYENGTLTPLEPLELQEGAEVTVTVEAGRDVETSEPKQGLAAVMDMVDSLRNSYPIDMWDGLPADLAKNKKHYLYGHPKEGE